MPRTTHLRLAFAAALATVSFAACATPGTTTAPSASTAPASVAPSVEAPSASPSAEVSASPSAAASTAPASPEARVVQVQAADDRFMNAPVDPTVGTVLTFRNVGQQAHEMVVLMRNADATDEQTFDDLANLNPADLLTFVTVVGVLAADPGQEATGQIELAEAGDYAIVDLLPQGTTTAPASPDPMAIPSGIPNIASGLFGTFTVTEPEAS